jgi:hypothetical protein
MIFALVYPTGRPHFASESKSQVNREIGLTSICIKSRLKECLFSWYVLFLWVLHDNRPEQ